MFSLAASALYYPPLNMVVIMDLNTIYRVIYIKFLVYKTERITSMQVKSTIMCADEASVSYHEQEK